VDIEIDRLIEHEVDRRAPREEEARHRSPSIESLLADEGTVGSVFALPDDLVLPHLGLDLEPAVGMEHADHALGGAVAKVALAPQASIAEIRRPATILDVAHAVAFEQAAAIAQRDDRTGLDAARVLADEDDVAVRPGQHFTTHAGMIVDLDRSRVRGARGALELGQRRRGGRGRRGRTAARDCQRGGRDRGAQHGQESSMEVRADGTLDRLSREVVAVFAPLADALASVDGARALLRELAWTPTDLPAPLLALSGAASAVDLALDRLFDPDATLDDVEAGLQAVTAVVDAIHGLETATYDDELEAADFASRFPRELLDYLVIRYLQRQHPRLAFALRATGVVEVETIPADAHRPAHVRRGLAWPNLDGLVTDPASVLSRFYGWGTADFDATALLADLQTLLLSFDVQAHFADLPEVESIALGAPPLDDRLRRRLDVPRATLHAPTREGAAASGMENITDENPSIVASRPPTYDQVARLLFVTGSYLETAAVRSGRSQQLIGRMAGLPFRLAATGFWELHYRRPVSKDMEARADEVAEYQDQGECAIVGLLAGLTTLCDEAVLRVAVEQVTLLSNWKALGS